jgi:hypothetical protein
MGEVTAWNAALGGVDADGAGVLGAEVDAGALGTETLGPVIGIGVVPGPLDELALDRLWLGVAPIAVVAGPLPLTFGSDVEAGPEPVCVGLAPDKVKPEQACDWSCATCCA